MIETFILETCKFNCPLQEETEAEDKKKQQH